MKFLGFLTGLQALWLPQHVMPQGPADELVVDDALQIRRSLGELARLQSSVALQSADGRFIGGGLLSIDSVLGLRVHLQSVPRVRADELLWPINATASSSNGLVLFTLHARTADGQQALCAVWPEQLIHLQSRRHFRLTGLSGQRRRAWLARPGSTDRVPVHDLSEEGVGLEVDARNWPEGVQSGPALLHLDKEQISVPLVEVVHTRPRAKDGSGIVGARMLGLSEEQGRLLRRWMSGMQAEQGGGAGSAA